MIAPATCCLLRVEDPALIMFLARLLSPLVLLAVVAAQGEDPLYDKTRLRDFHFTFHQSNWWTDLVASATINISIKADLSFDGATYKDVGIKVKGNTSSRTATKKPFNVSMDHFVAGRKLYGYKTVNLQLFNGPKSSPALVGLSLGSFQIDLGLLGPLLLEPTLMATVGVRLDALGYGGISLPLPTGTAGMTAYAQAAATDLSNAVVFTVAK